jgi:hypothetical protein
MSELSSAWCVLLPCSDDQVWAVPRGCLGEIVTVPADEGPPPQEINWRGEVVPVIDFGGEDEPGWRDPRGGTGLIAVFLGLAGEACPYWGVAVRGEGLGVSSMLESDIEDLPDAVLEHTIAAFRMQDTVYQVPDLPALQRELAAGRPGV